MKKILAILLICFSSGISFAYDSTNTIGGGYYDSVATKTTISQAVRLPSSTYVTLQGNIIKRLSDDKYLFKDSTGTIKVEIDNDIWRGQTIEAQDLVEITGELEKRIGITKIDVNYIKKLSK